MLTNYIKLAFRNMRKYRTYTLINVLGLAIGMSATILILLFIQYELSYDAYNTKADRIYRVSREWVNDKGESQLHLGHLAPPIGPLLKNDFEGIIEEMARMTSARGTLLEANDKKFEEENFFFAENEIFSIFSWKFISGDPSTALKEPGSMVITASAARKYFNDTDVVGEQMIFNNFGFSFPFQITGVVEDIPANSHFHWDFLASFRTVEQAMGEEEMQSWSSNNYSTYVLLAENQDIKQLEAGIDDFFDDHLGVSDDGERPSKYNRLHFWPLRDVNLYSQHDSEIEANCDNSYVYIYGIIALFTLAIACINFMNLSTAQSAQRSREVGMRKVLGAVKPALIAQFLVESVLFALFGLMLAFFIIVLVLPYVNDFFQRELSIDFLNNSFLWVIIIAIVVVAGVLAGLYPAFYLTRYQPANILKGAKEKPGSPFNVRSVLVVIQFFISIVLIIGVGIVYQQLNFVQNKNLGFQKDNIMLLPSTEEIYNRFGDVRSQLMDQTGILDVSLSSRVPSGRLLDSQGGEYEIDGGMKQIDMRIADIHVDFDFMSTFEINIAAGRDFNPELASDSTEAFILNEAAVNALGYNSPEDAVGKSFNYGGRQGKIVGVTKDFHFESLHQSIAPIVFMITQGRARVVSVKYDPNRKDEVASYLKDQWAYFRPGFPFSYQEVSEAFNEQYDNEARLAQLISAFSLLAIVIAAMGLFGLATFVVSRRKKEMGIRKVMGASVFELLVLLARNFMLLVGIAFLIAVPVAYFGMNTWLNEFAYRLDLNAWPFIIGGVLAFLIAWITISYHTMRAARTNPVDSLRYE